jgi:hypothetical protein
MQPLQSRSLISPTSPTAASVPQQPDQTSSQKPTETLIPQDLNLAQERIPLKQVLSTLNLVEEAPIRGAKTFEDLAIQQDSWGKISSHFKAIYNGKSTEREADLSLMAKRLGVTDAELKPLVKSLYANKMISPLAMDLGITELFFRRMGFAKGKAAIEKLEKFQSNPQSRLSDFERIKLASSIFRDLAVPGMIGQGGKGTCAGATLQVIQVSAFPDTYLKMALSLAEGKPFMLPDGNTLKPNDDWRKGNAEDRQLSEAVLQNAFIDLMMGPGKYHSNLDTGDNMGAPSAGQQRSGLEALSGHSLDYDTSSTIMLWPLSKVSASSGMGFLEDDLARGRPVAVNIWGHAMAVVGMDKTGPETKVIVSTYGAQIEMPAKGLEKYLMHSITVDDEGSDNKRIAPGQRVVIGTDLHRLPK